MNKNRFFGLTCGIAGVVGAGSCTSTQEKEWDKSPNVIYILADDLGIGDITPYGQKLIETPNLDRMAAEGMLFTQCYSGTAVSAPSRASLLTGLHTGHTYIRGNKRIEPEGQMPMPGDTYTIAKMFRDAGYATSCFGKWGLGYPGSESEPLKMGFDEFFGYNCQTKAHDYYPDHLWDGEERIDYPDNYNQAEGTYSADIIHGRARKFIRDNAARAFFAYLSYTLPHAELVLPKDSVYYHYCDIIPAEDDRAWAEENPQRRGAYGAAERPFAAFAAMVTRLDRYVGDIMEELDSLGIADNTVLIFTSDNGPHREGGANPDYFDSYGPYRGIKRELYEGGIRMPMIIRCPGHVAASSVNDHQMAFWDMMPTFAEIAGATLPCDTDGISFLPSLLGKDGQKEHEYLYWELHEKGGLQAIRVGDWKGVKLFAGYPDKTRFELYDLSTDVHEDNDLAAQYPDVVEKLKSMMDTVRTDSEIFDFSRL